MISKKKTIWLLMINAVISCALFVSVNAYAYDYDIAVYREATGLEDEDDTTVHDESFDTIVIEETAFTQQGGNVLVDLATAGHYFVWYNLHIQTSNGLTTHRTEHIGHIDLAGTDLAYGYGQGYTRTAGDGADEAYVSGGAIILSSSAGDDVKIEAQNTSSTTTNAAKRRADLNSMALVKFDDNLDYARIREATGGTNYGQAGQGVYINYTWDTQDELDGSFIHTVGQSTISLVGGAGHYLVTYNVRFNTGTTTTRTQMNSRLMVGGNSVEQCWSGTYIRGDSNSNSANDGACSGVCIVETTSDGEDLILQVANTSETAVAVTDVGGQSGITITKLPDTADYLRVYEAGGGQSVDVTAERVTIDTASEEDTDSFDLNTTTGIVTINKDGDYLFTSCMYMNRASGTNRYQVIHQWTVNGDIQPYGAFGQYNRGDQGTQDTYESSNCGAVVLPDMVSGNTVSIVMTDETASSGTAPALVADRYGITAVNLDTMLTYVWSGVTDGDWNDENNWEGPPGYPDSALDTAIINSTDDTISNLGSTISILKLEVAPTFTGLLNIDRRFSTANTLDLSGQFTLSASSATVQGLNIQWGFTSDVNISAGKLITSTTLAITGASNAMTMTGGEFEIRNTDTSLMIISMGTIALSGGTISYTGATATTAIRKEFSPYYNLYVNATGTYNFEADLTVNNSYTQAGGTVDTTAVSDYSLDVTNDFTVTGGAFNANDSTITVGDDFTVSATDAFDPGTSLVDLTSSLDAISIINCVTTTVGDNCFYDLEVAPVGTAQGVDTSISVGSVLTIGPGIFITVTNDESIYFTKKNAVPITRDPSSTIAIFNFSYTCGAKYVAGIHYGTSNVSFRPCPTAYELQGDVTVGNIMAVGFGTTNASPAQLTTTANDYSITVGNLWIGDSLSSGPDGELTLNDSTVTIGGSLLFGLAGASNILNANTSLIEVRGDWLNTNGGVMNMGTSEVQFDDTSGTSAITSSGESFAFLTVDDGGANALTVRLNDALDLSASLTINSGTLSAGVGSYTINIAGDWYRNGGKFLPQSGSVFFDGGDQAITGSNTFYNLYKIDTVNDGSGPQMAFPASRTQVVQNDLYLSGFDSDDLVSIVSDTPGTRSRISVSSHQQVYYLDVSDQAALGSDIVAAFSLDTTNNDSGEGSPQWEFGELFNISGTTDVNGVTVKTAIDGTLASENTVTSGGTWTIRNVTLNDNDIVTVWLDAVAEANESTGITENDGIGANTISGMELFANVLTIGSDEDEAINIVEANSYDNVNDEDIVFIATNNELLVDRSSQYASEALKIQSGDTFSITSKKITTHDLNNDGSLIATGAATIVISGSWDNAAAATFTAATSSVLMNSTATSETITTNGDGFYDLYINDGLEYYFSFEDATDPTHDDSGYERNASLINGAAQTTADIPTLNFANTQSMELQAGGSQAYLSLNDPLDALKTTATLAFWISTTQAGDDNIKTAPAVAGIYTGDTDEIIWGIINGSGQIGVDKGAVGGVFSTDPINDGRWYHVALTWDVSSGDVEVYINGSSQNLAPTGSGDVSTDFSSIGFREGAGNETYLEAFLDDVRIYNRILTATEIARLAAGDTPATGVNKYTLQDDLDINNDFFLNSGTVNSNVSDITIAGDWNNFGGVFMEGSNSVTLDGAAQNIPASETFYKLTKQVAAATTLTVGQRSTLTASHKATLQGAASNLLSLRSSTNGTRFYIDPQSTHNISFVDVKDSENINPPAINPASSVNSGNTAWWFGFDISGTSNLANGTNLAVAHNATLLTSVGTISSGAFTVSVTTATAASGDIITVWPSNVANNLESTGVAKYTGSGNITGMRLGSNTVTVGSDDNQSFTVANLGLYDQNNDEDIMYTSNSGVLDADSADYASERFVIQAGDTLTVTTLQTLQAHDLDIDGSLTIVDTGDIQISGSWDNDAAAVFTAGKGLVVFNSTLSETITSNTDAFYNAEIDAEGGTYTLADDMAVSATITFTAGVFDTEAVNDYDLAVGDAFIANGGTINANASTITVSGNFDIYSGHDFNAGTSLVDLIGTGTLSNTPNANAFYQLRVGADGQITTADDNVFARFLIVGAGTLTTGNAVNVNVGASASSGDQIVTMDVDAKIRDDGGTMQMWLLNNNATTGIFTMDGGDYAGASIQPLMSNSATVQLVTRDIILDRLDFRNVGGDEATFDFNDFSAVFERELDFSTTGPATVMFGSGTINLGATFAGASLQAAAAATSISLELESALIFVEADIVDSNGVMVSTAGSSTIVFDGASDYAAANLTLNDVMVGTTTISGTLTLNTKIDIDGDLTIRDGTFDVGAGSNTIFLEGSFSNYDVFAAQSGAVIFNGTAGSNTIRSGGDNFHDIYINDGLEYYFRFEETASPSIDDSGYGRDAVWVSSAATSQDTIPTLNFANVQSMLFISADASYIQTASPLDALQTTATLAFWISTTQAGDDDPKIAPAIAGVFDGGSSDEIIWGWINGNGNISFHKGAGDTIKSGPVNDGEWHHVAITWNSSTGEAQMYFDGSLSATDTTESGDPTVDFSSIGFREGAGFETYFDGYLDDVRIYNRILNGTEIARLAAGNTPAALGGGVYSLADAMDINGSFFINSGTIDSNGFDITLAGDWNNFGGVFVEGTNTVTLDGTTQNIPASETFYNLTKTTVSATTLTFGQRSTTAITNQTTLQGASGELLSLRSSTTGTRWYIAPAAGGRSISFVDVQDSENTVNPLINPPDSVNSGNNILWFLKKGAIMVVKNMLLPDEQELIINLEYGLKAKFVKNEMINDIYDIGLNIDGKK